MDAKNETGSHLFRNENHNHKKYSEIEKTKLLLDRLRNKQTVSGICKESGVNSNLLFNWKKDILEFDNQDYNVLRNGEAKKEVERLEIENIYLKQLISELRNENEILRININNNSDLFKESKSKLK